MSTTPNYTQYSGHSNTTITPKTNAELDKAISLLAENGGGTIVLDARYGPFQIDAANLGGSDSPVLIKAANPDNPPVISKIVLDNVSHMTITGVKVDHSSIADQLGINARDVRVTDSDHIEFVDNVFAGPADAYLDFSNYDDRASSGLTFETSKHVLLADNEVYGYFNGITFANSSDFQVLNNDIHSLQGDGMNGGGWVDAVVSGNHFHDFYGSNNKISHSDMIQMWGINDGPRHTNVEISSNVFDSSGMAPTQSIFISNKYFGTGDARDGYNDDIRIHDNIIHNGYSNGIVLGHTTNGQVYNNTVLWDQEANSHIPGDDHYLTNSMPQIRIWSSPGAEVTDNVAGNIASSDPSNYQLNYSNTSASNYVGKHVVDWSGGSDGLRDFSEYAFKSSSPLYGKTGSELSWGGSITVVRDATIDGGSEPDTSAPETPKDLHLYLVDSKTDEIIRELSSIDEVSASELSEGVYNLAAIYDGDGAGSMQFWLNGAWHTTEGAEPFVMFKDTAGDINDRLLPEDGSVENIEIRVFSGKSGDGTQLYSESFELGYRNPVEEEEVETPPVEDDTPIINEDVDAEVGSGESEAPETPEVDEEPETPAAEEEPETPEVDETPQPTKDVHLYLVDSRTDEVIRELASVDDINASELSEGVYNLAAVYDGEGAGSMQFWLNGAWHTTEGTEPYAVFKDDGGDLKDRPLPKDGTTENLEVRVFTGSAGDGTLLYSEAFKLGYVNQTEEEPEATDDTPPVEEFPSVINDDVEAGGGTTDEPVTDTPEEPSDKKDDEEDEEDPGNFFAKFFSMFFGIFGGSDDDDDSEDDTDEPGETRGKSTIVLKSYKMEITLQEIVPVNDADEDEAPDAEEDEEEDELLVA
jgi:hypothetical protein